MLKRRLVRRAAQRGLTLIEIMVVMLIIVVLMVGVVGGSGQLGGARLKHGAAGITGAVRVSFTRATATSKSLRLVFDIDKSALWLEEGDSPMLVQSKDKTGTGGAQAATDAERAAIAEGESILKGPKVPRPSFHPVGGITITSDQVTTEKDGTPAGGKGPVALPRKVNFRSVQTGHDDQPHTSGRAYLYFWPGGLTERASIQLRIGDSEDDSDTLTLLVSPLTGKVTVKNGPVALVIPTDDREASERQDNGAF
ncbi:MAG TPA: prepilin-type N-terminal cleavage/methylation domain-containing protein [Polyangiaceae bacterium]